MLRSLDERLLIGDFLEGRDLSWSNLGKLKTNHGQILLQREQIRVQREAADRYERAALFGAGLVASEIRSMTDRMEEALVDGFGDVVMSIDEAAERVSKSIDGASRKIQATIAESTEQLCGHLFGIEVQLLSNEEFLSSILDTLRESRANEARQLLIEANGLFRNEEFDEAKDSLLKAIEREKLNYDVLFMLGLVAWEKKEVVDAARWFGLAATRPKNQEPEKKARALAMQARALYVQEKYQDAHKHMQEAVGLMPANAHFLFVAALYAARAKSPGRAFEHLDQAILVSSNYFTKCSADPELNRNLAGIPQWLVYLTEREQKNIVTACSKVRDSYTKLLEVCPFLKEEIRSMEDLLDSIIENSKSYSYSKARHARTLLDDLQSTNEQLQKMAQAWRPDDHFAHRSSEISHEMATLRIKQAALLREKPQIGSTINYPNSPDHGISEMLSLLSFIIAWPLSGYAYWVLEKGFSGEHAVLEMMVGGTLGGPLTVWSFSSFNAAAAFYIGSLLGVFTLSLLIGMAKESGFKLSVQRAEQLQAAQKKHEEMGHEIAVLQKASDAIAKSAASNSALVKRMQQMLIKAAGLTEDGLRGFDHTRRLNR